jgi:hypothetical protein
MADRLFDLPLRSHADLLEELAQGRIKHFMVHGLPHY